MTTTAPAEISQTTAGSGIDLERFATDMAEVVAKEAGINRVSGALRRPA